MSDYFLAMWRGHPARGWFARLTPMTAEALVPGRPVGITTAAGITAGAASDAAVANRGPEGSSESSPRPKCPPLFRVLVFFNCAHIAPDNISYYDIIYLFRQTCSRSRSSVLGNSVNAYPFKSIVISLLRSRQRRHRGPFTTCFSSPPGALPLSSAPGARRILACAWLMSSVASWT